MAAAVGGQCCWQRMLAIHRHCSFSSTDVQIGCWTTGDGRRHRSSRPNQAKSSEQQQSVAVDAAAVVDQWSNRLKSKLRSVFWYVEPLSTDLTDPNVVRNEAFAVDRPSSAVERFRLQPTVAKPNWSSSVVAWPWPEMVDFATNESNLVHCRWTTERAEREGEEAEEKKTMPMAFAERTAWVTKWFLCEHKFVDVAEQLVVDVRQFVDHESDSFCCAKQIYPHP